MSDGEGGLDEDDGGYDDDFEDKLLSRNTNAEDVMKLEKLKKESLRQESAKKKEKDKEDREKQKQLAIDRKEKEKKRTQKGEKKRWYPPTSCHVHSEVSANHLHLWFSVSVAGEITERHYNI